MTTRASLPVLRELLDEARGKNYEHGVLGVRADLEWSGARTFTHGKVRVRVEPCVSALAVREALLSRTADEWLIVLTDRSDEDLGTGVLSHFIGHRLRTPDPWAAVRYRFAATGLDPALTSTSGNRDIAIGLLAATPPDRWPPAPAGVLTRDHAFSAIAAAHLGLTDPVIDIASVLAWTADPKLATRISDLRALAGDAVSDAALAWAAGRTGAISPTVLHLLRGGEARDAVSLGLIAGLLADARDNETGDDAHVARDALIRMESRTGGIALSPSAFISWAAESSAVVTEMLRAPARQSVAESLLTRADDLLTEIRAHGLAGASDLLPSGLTIRFADLAAELRSATSSIANDNPDRALVSQSALERIEHAWAWVASHHLAGIGDRRTPPFHAAVRLSRWLAAASSAAHTMSAVLRRHADQDAWVDSAVNDATAGVSDPDMSVGLSSVLVAVRTRRAAHDTAFAAALAAYTCDDPDPSPATREILRVEDLLPDVVMPLTRLAPVLLLVLDGMSAGVDAEVTASILARPRDGWAEALLTGQQYRAAAIAVLPTLTEVSRASLLSGGLRAGGQDAERSGFTALARAHGLMNAPLFHKKPLESARPGYALADDVATAISDVTRHPLVTCVLNTVDDALDRSDAAGIAWGTETVKHLAPLLDRARHAGRIVILTADHGHVIERRQSSLRQYPGISSGRSRPAAPPAGDGEILVTGRRVLLHDGIAVLAVNENLRYGPVKSGYHGGASPAEVVVPVTILVPGAIPDEAAEKLRLAPPQEPAWWLDPVTPRPGAAITAPAPTAAAPSAERTVRRQGTAPDLRKRPDEKMPTLFDEPDTDSSASGQEATVLLPPPTAEAAVPAPSQVETVAARILKSTVYTAQKKIAGRVSVTDARVAALLSALLAAPGRRLAPAAAATTLQVAPVLLRGAVLQVQKLLNVEGYAVLRVDADGATLILDEALLREQYGIGT
jgi:PglZ domain